MVKLPSAGWLVFILVLTGLSYFNGLDNEFVRGMDDDMYILDNYLIETLNLKEHFTAYVAGNYHPVTTISYALETVFFGKKAIVFHSTNLLLHIVNACLVFLFISRLLKNETMALMSAAVFALHPMHVESVSWISERKDLLYTLFYLGALLLYLKYNNGKKGKYLFFCGVLFVFSLLSKSMAVTLPFLFFVIDFFQKKKITIRSVLVKIPFIVLSVLVGIVALQSQASGNTYEELTLNYSMLDRVVMLCYTVVFYVYKFFIPINLSVYHFYPNKIGSIEQLSPLVLVVLGWWMWKVRKTEFGRILVFGVAFFTLSLLPVLQIIPVGRAFAAERYTYIAYIGLGLPLFYQVNRCVQLPKYKWKAIFMLAVVVLGWVYLTFERNKIWKSSETLFTDVINKNPNSGFGYYSRGVVYDLGNRLDLALMDYNLSIAKNPNFYKAYNNRAVVRGKKGELKGALSDCNNAIALKENFASAYNNRGNAKSGLGNLEGAIEDCSIAIKINPNFTDAYNNRASAYLSLSKFEQSLSDFQKLNQLMPNSAEVFQGIAASYQGLKEYEKSIMYFTKSIAIDSNNYIALFGRAASYFYQEDYMQAIADYDAVIKLNSKYRDAYANRGMAYFKLGNLKKACESWQLCKQNGENNVEGLIKSYCNKK